MILVATRLAGLFSARRAVLAAMLTMVCLVFTCCAALSGRYATSAALGVQARPAWQVTNASIPSALRPRVGEVGRYYITVENVGGATSEGPVEVNDALPAGLVVKKIISDQPRFGPNEEATECSTSAEEVNCTFPEAEVPSGFLVIAFEFEVAATISGTMDNTVRVSGGNGSTVTSSTSSPVLKDGEAMPAGIAHFGFSVTSPTGEPAIRAGGHPNLVTTSFLLNSMFVETVNEPVKPVEAAKELVFYLPLGLLGNPTVAEPCPASIVETQSELSGCPPASRVGTILPMILSNLFANTPDPTHVHGIYSVTPEKGYAAEFAFSSNNFTFFIYASVVRHEGVYMLRVATPGVPPVASLVGLVASFYGDIQEHIANGSEEGFNYDRGSFLTNPSDCEASLTAREAQAELSTWEHPESTFNTAVPAYSALEGCQLLDFAPTLKVTPQTTQADEPSGYEFGLTVPQAPNGFAGLATPPVRSVSITLPQGTTISPSSANGLLACDENGPHGLNIEGKESEAIGPDGLAAPVAGHCPTGSQLANVTAETPLLHEQLEGHLFLATPGCGGAEQPACTEEDASNGTLFGLYLELEAPNAGVIIKLKGSASVDPHTGRITATFSEGPQFPFSKLSVAMKVGARAPLANPQSCGEATSRGAITPWSNPNQPATPLSTFTVDWDGLDGSCPLAMPFGPSQLAGMANPSAGAYSPFNLVLRRADREQNIASVSTTLPEGMLAAISKVGRCPEPQASIGGCPAASEIGSVTAGVGAGSEPYFVKGKVYFTGPFRNAPFGLSVVVPAVAGPFNLGNVIVRVALFVDPHSAQVTAVSDAFPQELDGVPLHIRMLDFTLNAKEFTLNPTSCSQHSITTTVYSATGAVANLDSPFAVTNCNSLAFEPTLTATTEAEATKANGTGVYIKIAYPSPSIKPEANVSQVTVRFPGRLPVRLTTLQRACTASVFAANPAACPQGSNVGVVTVHTPVLSQPLVGPAYLVSYGSAKFPDVVFVLQGEGVTLDVDGQSNVSSSGVLKVTFPSVPDAPFTSVEARLPPGPFSQFTNTRATTHASVSQCGERLIAPVHMVSYSGLEISRNVQFAIKGCRQHGLSIVLRKLAVKANTLVLAVQTSQVGELRLSGNGLKALTRRRLHAGSHVFHVGFTTGGAGAHRSHRVTVITGSLAVGRSKARARVTVRL